MPWRGFTHILPLEKDKAMPGHRDWRALWFLNTFSLKSWGLRYTHRTTQNNLHHTSAAEQVYLPCGMASWPRNVCAEQTEGLKPESNTAEIWTPGCSVPAATRDRPVPPEAGATEMLRRDTGFCHSTLVPWDKQGQNTEQHRCPHDTPSAMVPQTQERGQGPVKPPRCFSKDKPDPVWLILMHELKLAFWLKAGVCF